MDRHIVYPRSAFFFLGRGVSWKIRANELGEITRGVEIDWIDEVSWRSHPLCPRQPKSVTSDLWRQMWLLHRRFFGKAELAAGGNCSGLDKLQLAWLEAALPWCAAGQGRSVLAAACLAISRYLATAGLFHKTQLHGTPARRDIPRRPSNQTFVSVPKLKRNTSRRPPSALIIWQFISCSRHTKSEEQPFLPKKTAYILRHKRLS